MKTLEQLLQDGIKPEDWTYCKPEYAPHEGCKIGMPEEFTPDGTIKLNVKVCYIVTAKFRNGEVLSNPGMMYLSDGKFYWYDNLWKDYDVVEQEIEDKDFIEPIAWIAYRNVPDQDYIYPVPPFNADAVPEVK